MNRKKQQQQHRIGMNKTKPSSVCFEKNEFFFDLASKKANLTPKNEERENERNEHNRNEKIYREKAHGWTNIHKSQRAPSTKNTAENEITLLKMVMVAYAPRVCLNIWRK